MCELNEFVLRSAWPAGVQLQGGRGRRGEEVADGPGQGTAG
jgi:hypothetical protein